LKHCKTCSFPISFAPWFLNNFDALRCPTWLYQASQDWGIERVKYGLYSHSGDWSESEIQWQAEFLNAPLIACKVAMHRGTEGSEFYFCPSIIRKLD